MQNVSLRPKLTECFGDRHEGFAAELLVFVSRSTESVWVYNFNCLTIGTFDIRTCFTTLDGSASRLWAEVHAMRIINCTRYRATIHLRVVAHLLQRLSNCRLLRISLLRFAYVINAFRSSLAVASRSIFRRISSFCIIALSGFSHRLWRVSLWYQYVLPLPSSKDTSCQPPRSTPFVDAPDQLVHRHVWCT